MAIAQEIFSRFNEPWADKVISTAKWSEKKEMLDQLIKVKNINNLHSIILNYFMHSIGCNCS